MLALGLLAVAAATTPPPDDPARIERRRAVLAREVDLASTGEPYLLLDPASRTLALYRRGVVLRSWSYLRADVGRPRVAFFRRAAPEPWTGRIWSDGELEPSRVARHVEVRVDTAAPDARPAEEVVPGTPEETYPAPDRFFLRFGEPFALEVRAVAPGREAVPDDRWDPLALRPREARGTRLRLWMPADEAGALYRALPDGIPLLVLEP